jgi:hypothetical protein
MRFAGPTCALSCPSDEFGTDGDVLLSTLTNRTSSVELANQTEEHLPGAWPQGFTRRKVDRSILKNNIQQQASGEV